MTDQDELTLSDDEGDDLPDEALAELAAIEDDEPADEAAARGFPVGAPGRLEPSVEGMTAAEKIAFGLERRTAS